MTSSLRTINPPPDPLAVGAALAGLAAVEADELAAAVAADPARGVAVARAAGVALPMLDAAPVAQAMVGAAAVLDDAGLLPADPAAALPCVARLADRLLASEGLAGRAADDELDALLNSFPAFSAGLARLAADRLVEVAGLARRLAEAHRTNLEVGARAAELAIDRPGSRGESQRAMVAARIANMEQGHRSDLPSKDAKLSQSDAGKLLNVSVPSVQRTGRVA